MSPEEKKELLELIDSDLVIEITIGGKIPFIATSIPVQEKIFKVNDGARFTSDAVIDKEFVSKVKDAIKEILEE